MAEYRLRVCYGKTGRLRFLSHLEVVRAMERTIRRAGIPYLLTQGFSPRMRIAFGPALPVGTAGEREYLDLFVSGYSDAGTVRSQLQAASVPELETVEAGYVGQREPALSASAVIAVYEVLVEGRGVHGEAVQAALDRVMAAGEFVVEHKGKTKVFDLARSVPKEPRARSTSDGVAVDLIVRMGQHGSLRPDALLTASLATMPSSGAVTTVTRKDTLLEPEEGVWTRPL